MKRTNKKKSGKSTSVKKNTRSNVCPRCGSTHLKHDRLLSIHEIGLVGGSNNYRMPDGYLCMDCLYYGICPIIDDDHVKEFATHIKEIDFNEKNETSFEKKFIFRNMCFLFVYVMFAIIFIDMFGYAKEVLGITVIIGLIFFLWNTRILMRKRQ